MGNVGEMRTAFLLLASPLVPLGTIALAQAPAPPPPVVSNPIPVIADNVRQPADSWDRSKPYLTNVSDIFSADNYPELAREREVQGRVRVKVKVDAGGLATHCSTLGSPPPELGGPTCALILAQGRFEPARDRKGRPIKGNYEQSVMWLLEDLEPAALAELSDRLTFTFDDEAVITDCKRARTATTPVEEGEPDPCKAMALGAKFVAAAAGFESLSDWQMHFEVLVRTGEIEFWRSVGTGPDERMISLGGYTLQIAADGSVAKCSPISPEQEFLPEQPVTCEDLKKGRYVAASEAKRMLHLVNIAYWKRRTPSATSS